MGNLNTAFIATDLKGSIDMFVTDNSTLPTPNTVLVGSNPFFVDVKWNIEGLVAPAIGGDFKVEFYVESIGAGPEQVVASATVAANSVVPSNNRNYSTLLTVPAGALPNGPYKTVTVLTHKNLGVSTSIAGFADGPMIQITTP